MRSAPVDLNGAGVQVRIGEREYIVVPQRIGRIRSQLGIQFRNIEGLFGDLEGNSVDSFLNLGMERVHSLLVVFIPTLMPLYEFCGYPTEEAHESDDYNEEYDRGPDVPQLRHAFEVCVKVNSLDLLGQLKNVFSPELIRAIIQEQVLGRLAEATSSQTEPSTSTSSTSGPELGSTTSGPTNPTSTEKPG